MFVKIFSKTINKIYITVDLVIFACLIYCESPILGLLTKFRIRDLSFFLVALL